MKNSVQLPWKGSITLTVIVLVLLLIPSETFISVSPVMATRSGGVVRRHSLPGHLIPLLKKVPPLGEAPQSTRLQLSIGLTPLHPQALDALLAAQANPASTLYHQYVTPQAFKMLFGPRQTTVNALVTYFQKQGLHVESVAPNNLFITASGTAAVVEKAFGTTLNQYKLNGRLVYAPAADPSVPDALAPAIQTVGGLDNVAHYHPLGWQRKRLRQAGSGTQGYTPSEIRTAYHLNPLLKAGANGMGQTVALFELDGYNPADIKKYRAHYNLDVGTYAPALVGGALNVQGADTSEVALDMEMLSALAPGAAQKVYIGPNSVAGVNATYNQIVTDNVAHVVSTSWGECEQASGIAELQALGNIFKQGAAQGQSFFAASGDEGAYDCQNTDLTVDTPAADPNVIGVGGTTLHTGEGGMYEKEIAWGTFTGSQKGGGGGMSDYFPRPAYQSGIALATPSSTLHRLVPDVSANANPEMGYEVYCTGIDPLCKGWLKIGGTSAAAPLWAAIAADINQYLIGQHVMPLGHANAIFYTIATTARPFVAFHDITEGTNLYYPAHVGYDLATGLGTPDAWNLARDAAILFSPPRTLLPSPVPTTSSPIT